jgi:hypothetical protein
MNRTAALISPKRHRLPLSKFDQQPSGSADPPKGDKKKE